MCLLSSFNLFSTPTRGDRPPPLYDSWGGFCIIAVAKHVLVVAAVAAAVVVVYAAAVFVAVAAVIVVAAAAVVAVVVVAAWERSLSLHRYYRKI